jgi:predicted HTH transcriptional regulator
MDLENKITSKEIVETGLGSIGKVKIIKALAEQEKMVTTYTLQKKTHLKREDIKRNLNDLIKIGWVKEIRLANIMYSLNLEDHYIISLITFFKEVGYIGFL